MNRFSLQSFGFIFNVFIEFIKATQHAIERVKLNNGIDLLLIHNPQFQTSAFSINIDAGAMYDPPDIAGLAHIAEHIIAKTTIQSKKYDVYKYAALLELNSCGTITNRYLIFRSHVFTNMLQEASEYYANALINPLIDKESCMFECKIIDHEYHYRTSNFDFVSIDFVRHFIDENSIYSKFVVGNIDTLKENDIHIKVADFCQDYITGNRITIIMASSKSLLELKEIAKSFEKIPRGKLKAGVSENDNTVPFNDKYIVQSLLYNLNPFIFKSKYNQMLLRCYSSTYTSYLLLNFLIRSESIKNEYKLAEYFREVLVGDMQDNLQKELQNDKVVKNITVQYFHTPGVIDIRIFFWLIDEDEEKVKHAINMFYTWLMNHDINEEAYKYMRDQALNSYIRSNNAENVVEEYLAALVNYDNDQPEQIFTTYVFDQDELDDFFDKLFDMENLICIYCKFDNTLPKEVKLHFSDDSEDISDLVLTEYTDIAFEQCKIAPTTTAATQEYKKCSFETFLAKNSKTLTSIHEECEKGEYTLISPNNSHDMKYCSIRISFLSSMRKSEQVSHELFQLIFINRIFEKFKQKSLWFEIIHYIFNFDENTIDINAEASEIQRIVEIICADYKDHSFTDEEKTQAINEYIDNVSSFKDHDPEEYLSNNFKCLIKNIQEADIERVKVYSPKPSDNCYVKITVLGAVDMKPVVELFQQLQSKNPISKLELLRLKHNRKEYFYTRNGLHTYESLSFVYPVQCNSNILEEFAIAKLLIVLLNKYFYIFISIDNALGYSYKVDWIYINEQLFIQFMAESVPDIEKFKIEMKAFMSKFEKFIAEEINEEEMTYMKQLACYDVNTRNDTKNTITMVPLYIKLINLYGADFENQIVQTINQITKQNLVNLNIFKTNPFVVEPWPDEEETQE